MCSKSLQALPPLGDRERKKAPRIVILPGPRWGHESKFPSGFVRALAGSLTGSLVALYRAMRLRFGYGFESRDANGPRNVKNTYLAKHRPVSLPPLLLIGSKELVLKAPKRGQFDAIRVTI